jgi:hypothetical protein
MDVYMSQNGAWQNQQGAVSTLAPCCPVDGRWLDTNREHFRTAANNSRLRQESLLWYHDLFVSVCFRAANKTGRAGVVSEVSAREAGGEVLKTRLSIEAEETHPVLFSVDAMPPLAAHRP